MVKPQKLPKRFSADQNHLLTLHQHLGVRTDFVDRQAKGAKAH